VTRVFVDASALVPFVVREDQWHPQLRRILIGLRRGGSPSLVTTNWTLYESLAVSQRRGKAHAGLLYRLARHEMNVVPVSAEVESVALDRFLAWSDKFASVVDHANLLVAEASRCEAIVSFDSDFAPLVRGAGIRLIP
jgi:predicted nucleic acid-binding protein